MEYVLFAVDEKPYACWDWNLASRNREFLRGLDPDYFRYLIDVHGPELSGPRRLHAAVVLRLAHSQALESLFSLLCAMIQAPACIVGWMLTYRNVDLERLVRKISQGQEVYVHKRYAPVSWETLATRIHSSLPYDAEKTAWIQDGFGRLWKRFAREFLDTRMSQEYNAFKHGLRPRPGGFHLRVGEEPSPGVAPPPDEMRDMGGSEFGSSLFVIEKIGPDGHSFRPRRLFRNWSPNNLVNALGLTYMSIRNVLSFLRIENGDPPGECKFMNPDTSEAFRTPWAESIGVIWDNLDTVVGVDDIRAWTKDEILRSYEEHEQGPR